MQERTRTRRWGRRLAGLALVMVVSFLSLAGCDDDPEECMRAEAGEFYIDTQDLPAPADSAADFHVETEATLRAVTIYPGKVPPSIEYEFRADVGALTMQVPDLGTPFPVEIDSTYTLIIEVTRHLIPKAYGIKIFDGGELIYMAVTDWQPLSRIFKSGYGNLDGQGELQVFLNDPGCPPREENTRCYREKTNQRLEFVVGGQNALLWHGERAQLGSWIFHAHKAARVSGKAGCMEALLDNNGVSFVVERAGLP